MSHLSYARFEEELKHIIQCIRDEIAQVEDISEFEFIIKASGRAHDGDLNLSFEIDHPYKSNVEVVGDGIGAVIEEFMRRHGWTKRHAPIAIGFNGYATSDVSPPNDEIPF